MFPCIFSIKVNFSTRTSCEFVGVLHWILIRSLEFLAPLRTLKWHQLHFLYWNFIVPAWPHFFVLHMFSLLWAASLPRCAQGIRQSAVFVFPAVPPCAGHPRDKAAFLPQDKAALLAQGTRAPFPDRKLPQSVAALCWEVCRVLLSPLTQQDGEHPAMGSDMGHGHRGGQWLHTGQCETSLSCSGKTKSSGKQRKGKVNISVCKTRLSPALKASTWSSICSC